MPPVSNMRNQIKHEEDDVNRRMKKETEGRHHNHDSCMHLTYVRDEEVSPCDVSVTPVTRARVTRGVTPRHEMSRADVTMSQDHPQ